MTATDLWQDDQYIKLLLIYEDKEEDKIGLIIYTTINVSINIANFM